MKEIALDPSPGSVDTASFRACVATVLELPLQDIPEPAAGEDAATGWSISRWLGGYGLGIVQVAQAASFSWPGPWIARVGSRECGTRRSVVMYGVPSGVVWDPAGDGSIDDAEIEDGFLIAAADIALARPPRAEAPRRPGRVETIAVASGAGEPTRAVCAARALPGRGLEGDRHVSGDGTFPSGLPGSALTLIEAEVCESFDPPLAPDEHRRNVVTRGIELNGLVGMEFRIGAVRCRGRRLCEPCTVVQRYAGRPVLRALAHRGGLRADILDEGDIAVGDALTALVQHP